MINSFYEIDSLWQIFLLVLSQLTTIVLACGCILAFWYKYSKKWQLLLGIILLIVNTMLYIMMQLDSRITGARQAIHLSIPYIVLCLGILFSLLYAIWLILHETNNKKIINQNSIKEAFDNLPAGVCFFNETGLLILCNKAMHRFSFAVCGKDVQFVTDLKECLSKDFLPVEGTVKEGKVFKLPDGVVWQLETRSFRHENGETYIQYIALDITKLQQKRITLTEENAQLQRVQRELKRLSANVVAITREEEILNTKMSVHDEMGKCLLVAQKYLREDRMEDISDSVVTSWQRAISMLKYNNDVTDEDMLAQIRKTCENVNLTFIQKGQLPKQEKVAYILTCAVRECVTNAVRYAKADELYVEFLENENEASVVITNSGLPPKKEIEEGGGLSTLRKRVENVGGIMSVQSLPTFKMTITIPKRKEAVL